jgi:hypothetical protein
VELWNPFVSLPTGGELRTKRTAEAVALELRGTFTPLGASGNRCELAGHPAEVERPGQTIPATLGVEAAAAALGTAVSLEQR